jgi:hypothetical protein
VGQADRSGADNQNVSVHGRFFIESPLRLDYP